jgi:hypothetical protein
MHNGTALAGNGAANGAGNGAGNGTANGMPSGAPHGAPNGTPRTPDIIAKADGQPGPLIIESL